VKRLREEILETYLRDEIGARRMDSQGIYAAKVLNGGSDCQMVFMTQPHRPNA